MTISATTTSNTPGIRRAIDRAAEAVWFCRWAELDEHQDVRAALERLTATILSCCSPGALSAPLWPDVIADLTAVANQIGSIDEPSIRGRVAYASRLIECALADVRRAAPQPATAAAACP